MKDRSIFWVQQLQMLYRQRCCMSASQRMFGSLLNVVVAHEHRRQDGRKMLQRWIIVAFCWICQCSVLYLSESRQRSEAKTLVVYLLLTVL